jgi:two-component system, cell cycle sensor histidine kinase and response regulator CckA
MAPVAIAAFLFGLCVMGAVWALYHHSRRRRQSRSTNPEQDLHSIIAHLFESTPNGVGLWDRDLRFLRVNKALADMHGLAPEAHVGKGLKDVLPILADTLEPIFRDVLRTGQPRVNIEIAGETPAHPGDQRLWRASYYPLRRDDGGIDGVGAVVVDMTEAKRAEYALRQSEERYRAFIEQTAEAVWRVELEQPVSVDLPADEQVRRFMASAYLAECNDAMARMYGFETAAEIVGARLPDLLDPADPKNIAFLTAFILSGYRLIEAESHERARDGSERYFLNNLIGIIEGGEVCRAWGTQRDITERKWADEALRQSREQLRVALKAARLATWRWDLHSDARAWHAEFATAWNGPEGSTDNGRAFLDQVHPDDRARVSQAVSAAVEGAGQYREEYRVVSPDGSIHWVADQGEVILDDHGLPLYMAGACVDVTHHREVEAQLRQVQRMDAVGRLAGGMAHETNNQMAVVLGFAEFVLGRSDLTERVREDVEQIRKAAERTAGITSQLLAFSRRQFARPKVLELNQVVAAFEPVLRRAMSDGCELRIRPASGLGRVKADPGQVEQVLLNLALNACDAMPHGGTLMIETANVTLTPEYTRLKRGVQVLPGRYALIAVSDTGHGMTRETLSRVFEPFFTTKAVGQGTGLGLATVYGLVKQADGYVWVYSERGIGTTFKIYLPVIPSEEPVSSEAEFPPTVGSGELILMVEDEADVMRMAARSLREAGYTVLEASGGREALAIFREAGERLHLVVTDVIMPVMSGRDLANRIEEVRPGLPIIFMSGYTDEDVIRRGLLERGRRFIQKPFSPDELARQVQQALTREVNAEVSSRP